MRTDAPCTLPPAPDRAGKVRKGGGMTEGKTHPTGLFSGEKWFPTTRWTMVVQAGELAGEAAARALEELCQAYWRPLYVYVRRRGVPAEKAEDLIQGFFADFLARDHVAQADRRKGRLRSYLLGALNHYLSDATGRERRQKRGGGRAVLSLDLASTEAGYLREAVDDQTPDQLYERRWALALLERVLDRLKAEHHAAGRGKLFDELKPLLLSVDAPANYGPLARKLGRSEGALRVAVHRMRRRYGQLLRNEVAEVVADPADIDDELRHLVAVLAGRG